MGEKKEKNLPKSLTNQNKLAMMNIGVKIGTVVQLVRALPCHGRSCGFEPRQSRQKQ